MNNYEYVVKEGDTLQSLSETFYRDKELYPYLARHNYLKTGTISVNQKIKIPRILIGESETNEKGSVLHLIYRSSSDVNSEAKIIQVYFEDSSGKKTEVTGPDQKVSLVVETKNLIGKKVDFDLSDATFNYEYNGEILENDFIRDFEINADTIKIELKSVQGR